MGKNHAFKNIVGEKFGKLLAVERVGVAKDRSVLWKCICDCGNEKLVDAKSLRRGNTKSCGCLAKLPSGEAEFRQWFHIYSRGAKERELDFDLTKDQFRELIQKNCEYCGTPPELRHKRTLNGGIIMNGIDRLDSSIGYSVDNCRPCCKKCNVMKYNFSLTEFLNHIEKILNHYKRS